MKRIVLWLLCLLGTPTLYGQYSIRGKISEQGKSEGISSAVLYFSELKTGTQSDKFGEYFLGPLKRGRYLLEVSSVGYRPLLVQLEVTNDSVINFELRRSSKELSEVIVTGVARSTEIRRSPVFVKALDMSSLSENSTTNLIDALKVVPGVDQITTGSAVSKPVIRGLGYNRVIVLNNGIRQEGQQWGDEHGIEMDEYSIERVEIIKGPGSLMYGSDGIAGVLNFISPKPMPLGEICTQVLSQYQSNGNFWGNSVANSGNIRGIQWTGRLSSKIAGNYDNAYDGKVLNSGFREYNGSLFLGLNRSWGHSHWSISSWNSIINLPEGERDSSGRFTYVTNRGEVRVASPSDYAGYTIGIPHQKVNHFRVSSNQYFLLKKGELHVDVGYQENQRREFGDVKNPDKVDLHFDLRTLNYQVRYNVKPYRLWESSIGLSGMYQQNRNFGAEFLIPAYLLFDAGVFVHVQRSFKKLTLAGGLRFDRRSLQSSALWLDSAGGQVAATELGAERKFSEVDRVFTGFSGSLGISYLLGKHSTLKINVSRGFRAPTMAELSSNGQHEGSFRYEIGNAGLGSELSHQIDFGYFLDSEHLTFEVTPFVNWISHFVFTEKLKAVSGGDSIPDTESGSPAFQFTSGNARLMGGEVFFDIHPHPLDWLHVEQNFSFVQGIQLEKADSLRNLPQIPAARYRAEVRAEVGTLGKYLKGFYVKMGVSHYFEQSSIFSAYGTETVTPAYSLLNIGVGGKLVSFGKKERLIWSISGDNLADVGYQSHLSRLKYAPENLQTGRMGIFNMGRNFSFKVVLSF